MKLQAHWLILTALVWSCLNATAGGTNNPPDFPTIADKVTADHLEARPGFFPLYWDAKLGRLWLQITNWDADFLYYDSLPAGLGSSDVGLDRGQVGQSRVVHFTRIGPKVLLVERNLGFRAEGASPATQKSVNDSFVQSVLAGFKVVAEDKGAVLVDATDFFVRDAHGVADTLRQSGQGDFKVDDQRSAVYLPNTRNFPLNTEVEVLLTFEGSHAGDVVGSIATDPTALTFREHHSLVQLPPPGYVPRPFDPRAGYFTISYADYNTPLGEPLQHQFITRHRLAKKDPAAAQSEPVTPIIYYLDPGTPEPIRSALLDGARWWNQAFEAAGYLNAFRVELLPDDAVGRIVKERHEVHAWK